MRYFLAFFLVVVSFGVRAHEYYFSFTEVEVDTTENQLEITVKLAAHDVEHYLESEGYDIALEKIKKDSKTHEFLMEWIRENFRISANDTILKLIFKGKQVEKDDDLYLYFAADFSVPESCSMSIQNKLLFSYYPSQQNRVRFKWNKFQRTQTLTRGRNKMKFDYDDKK